MYVYLTTDITLFHVITHVLIVQSNIYCSVSSVNFLHSHYLFIILIYLLFINHLLIKLLFMFCFLYYSSVLLHSIFCLCLIMLFHITLYFTELLE